MENACQMSNLLVSNLLLIFTFSVGCISLCDRNFQNMLKHELSRKRWASILRYVLYTLHGDRHREPLFSEILLQVSVPP